MAAAAPAPAGGAKNKVLEACGISGLQKSLDRLADLLAKVQKALGEYLEQQRLMFARFYS